MNMVYKYMVVATCILFIATGIVGSIVHKDMRLGIASVFLGTANFLLMFR